jgi:endonuclease YncB( thermonuclease family)
MRRAPAILLTIALAASSLLVRTPSPSAAQEAGNHYVSGTYGFRVTWDDRIWFVIDQGIEDEWDQIVLSDGITYVFISAGFGYDGLAEPCVDDAAEAMARTPGIDGLTPLVGDDGEPVRGEERDRAFGTYSYTYTYAGGETVEFIRYVECRPLIQGESVVAIDVVAPAQQYDNEFPLAQELLANLTLPSPGEPGPVFLSDHWRLAVAGAERGDGIQLVDLTPKAGKDWLVVVLDATNWGSSDDALNPRDFELRLAGTDDPIRLAPSSTVKAAAELETGPATANRGVRIPAGETRRLTLVFQIPDTATLPALVRAGTALPLDDVLAGDNLADLPPALGPPHLREARVDSVLGGELLRITFLSDDQGITLDLIGTDAPLQGDCHGQETAAALDALIGETVLVEREPGTPTEATISGYLWTETDDGTPVLFNQLLVAGGYASVAAGETDTRFGTWLAETEQVAKTTGQGLWSECASPHDRPLATPAGS